MSDRFKRALQTVVGSRIGQMGDEQGEVQEAFRLWFSKSQKHLIICRGVRGHKYTPGVVAAELVYRLYGENYIPVYDPIILLDRFGYIDSDKTDLIFIYDFKVLAEMPEYQAVRFFSYLKYSLSIGLRCVMAMDCGFNLQDMDVYLKNKWVVNKVLMELSDPRYCATLEV